MEKLLKQTMFFYINDSKNKEKICFGLSNGKHLTIHFGTKSKYFDIHITDERNNFHDTIFKIKHFAFFKLLLMIEEDLMKILIKYNTNKINIGKLKRNNSFLIPWGNNDKIPDFAKISKKNKKLNIDFDKFLLKSFDDELVKISNILSVYKVGKNRICKNGILFKRKDIETYRSYIFLSEKNIKSMRNEIKILLYKYLKLINLDEKEKFLELFEKSLNKKTC